MSDNLKTVHIETGMAWLGGPLQVVQLMKGLVRRGHTAHLICRDGSAIQQHAQDADLPVRTFWYPSDFDSTVVFRLRRLLRELNPDVVHLHSRRGADLWGGIAARTAGTKAVILSRRVDYPPANEPMSFLKFGRLCDKVVTVSNGIKDVLVRGGIPAEKIVCVHSCVDASLYNGDGHGTLRKELGVSVDVPLIGMVGRLIGRKGHRFLLDAAPEILAKHPETRFIMLGSGPLTNRLKQHARRVGASDRVLFLGFRQDIPQIVRDLDILVHPATREGLGVAILQAMASRVPVVATPVGGIPEAVRHDVNGMIVPPRDPAALGSAIVSLLNAPDVRRDMGEAGHRIVHTEFSPDNMVEKTLDVYREILASKQSGLG